MESLLEASSTQSPGRAPIDFMEASTNFYGIALWMRAIFLIPPSLLSNVISSAPRREDQSAKIKLLFSRITRESDNHWALRHLTPCPPRQPAVGSFVPSLAPLRLARLLRWLSIPGRRS